MQNGTRKFGIDRRRRKIHNASCRNHRISFSAYTYVSRQRSQTERNCKVRKRPISKHNQRTQLIIIAICYQSQVYANIRATGVKSRIIVFHGERWLFTAANRNSFFIYLSRYRVQAKVFPAHAHAHFFYT